MPKERRVEISDFLQFGNLDLFNTVESFQKRFLTTNDPELLGESLKYLEGSLTSIGGKLIQLSKPLLGDNWDKALKFRLYPREDSKDEMEQKRMIGELSVKFSPENIIFVFYRDKWSYFENNHVSEKTRWELKMVKQFHAIRSFSHERRREKRWRTFGGPDEYLRDSLKLSYRGLGHPVVDVVVNTTCPENPNDWRDAEIFVKKKLFFGEKPAYRK